MTNFIHNTIQTKVIRHWNIKTTNQSISHLFSQRLHCNRRHRTSLSIIINTNNHHNEDIMRDIIISLPLRFIFDHCLTQRQCYTKHLRHTHQYRLYYVFFLNWLFCAHPRLLFLDKIILLGRGAVYWFTCTIAEKCVCRVWNEQIFTMWSTQWSFSKHAGVEKLQ